MLKVVVFDSGYGGELFADRLKENLPVLEIIRVIDWRHADQILANRKQARKAAEDALRPYLGKVDLIIFANYLLSLTGLKYFKRKYKTQKFLGLKLPTPDGINRGDILILTTSAVTKTLAHRKLTFHLRHRCHVLTLDSWPAKIDDGELSATEIADTIATSLQHRSHRKRDRKHNPKHDPKPQRSPREIILVSTHFDDIRPTLKQIYSKNLKIYDTFDLTLRGICKTLNIRGGTGKKRK